MNLVSDLRRSLVVLLTCLLPCVTCAAQGAEAFAEGVVVENVSPGFALAEADLRTGDLVIGWVREDGRRRLSGTIRSTVEFLLIEAEHGPLEGFSLIVQRGSERMELAVPPRDWRGDIRPVLTANQLTVYGRARAALAESRWDDAVEEFDSLADQMAQQGRTADAVWLLTKAASARTSQRRMDAANRLIEEAERLCAQERAVAAWALHAAGADLWQKGEHAEAERHISRGLQIRESLDPHSLVTARSLAGLAVLTSSHSEFDRARQYAGRLLQLARSRAPGTLVEAEAHHQLGNIAFWSDDLDGALQHHRRALAIRSSVDKDGFSHARSLGTVANVLWKRGELEAAIAHFERARMIFERLEPHGAQLAQAFMNLAYVAQDRKNLTESERHLLEALAIYERIAPNAEQVASIRNALGQIYRMRGDYVAADDSTLKALAQYQALAPKGLQESLALANLAEIAIDRGDLAAARAHGEASVGIVRSFGTRGRTLATLLEMLGRIESEAGQFDQARAHLTEALEILETNSPRGLPMVEVLTSLGRLHATRDVVLSRTYLSEAIEIAKQIAPGSLHEATALYELARLERHIDPNRAVELFSSALDALESQRTLIGGFDEGYAHFSERHSRYYTDYIDLLVSRDRVDEAFSVSERYRARALLDAFSRRREISQTGVPQPLLREHERAVYRYDQAFEKVRRFEASESSPDFKVALDGLRAARLELYAVRDRMATSTPRSPSRDLLQPRSAPHIAKQLQPDTALLSYVMTPTAVHLFVVVGSQDPRNPGSVTFLSNISRDVARLQEEIKALFVQMRAHAETADAQRRLTQRLSALHSMLIEPASALIRGKDRLVIVPDGPLHRVPWSALVSERADDMSPRYLLEDFRILVAPSATFHVEAHPPRRQQGPVSIVAFAAPIFELAQVSAERPDSQAKDRARTTAFESRTLAGVSAEVGAIQALFAHAVTRTGRASTESEAKRLAGRADILHFAAHAVANESSPLDSYIALAPSSPESIENGLLQAWEVMTQMRLKSDLVVLSACETAGGREGGGEGLLGLTRAFHYAGAAGVIASLWPVSDVATTALMQRFYERVSTGEPPEIALRSAQLAMLNGSDRSWIQNLIAPDPYELRRSWRHPFYWSGFQLSGASR